MIDTSNTEDVVLALRAKLSAEERGLLDRIWESYRTTGKPLARRALHLACPPRSKVLMTLGGLGGSVVFADRASGPDPASYSLTLLGGLLTTNGDRVEVALAKLLYIIRDALTADVSRRSLTSEYLRSSGRLSVLELELVQVALRLHSAGLNWGGTWGIPDWTATIPEDIDAVLESVDLESEVRKIASIWYDKDCPIEPEGRLARAIDRNKRDPSMEHHGVIGGDDARAQLSTKRSCRIFLSHAAADKAIADAVVDLLDLAMGVNVHDDVFCSSLEGLGIPSGSDFKAFIKDKIQSPELVILLISRNYLASQFCLAEAGASWAMSHRVLPLLVPPVQFAEMKAVLAGLQASLIDSKPDWNGVVEIVRSVIGCNPNLNRWETKRDEVLQRIGALLKSQSPPPLVPIERLQEVERQLAKTRDEVSHKESEVQRLTGLVATLRAAKTLGEVSHLEVDSLPGYEQLKAHAGSAKRALQALPKIVHAALYLHYRKELLAWPVFDESQERAIRGAIEREYLVDRRESGVAINPSDPKVRRAMDALEVTRECVDTAPPSLAKAFADHYDTGLSFRSRGFWDAMLW